MVVLAEKLKLLIQEVEHFKIKLQTEATNAKKTEEEYRRKLKELKDREQEILEKEKYYAQFGSLEEIKKNIDIERKKLKEDKTKFSREILEKMQYLENKEKELTQKEKTLLAKEEKLKKLSVDLSQREREYRKKIEKEVFGQLKRMVDNGIK